MGRPSVLLVEDNPLDALLITEQLGDSYAFRRAESLSAAVREIQATPPEAAVADLTLPDGRGPAVIEALRAVAPDVPLIAHSGMDAQIAADAALTAGARVYVTKSSSGSELLAALHSILG